MDAFKNRIAIVTGGASGLGRALCEELSERGATVIVADINKQAAWEVADALKERGGSAEAAELDVANSDAVNSVVAQIISKYGRLDYIFNNAAIAVVGELRDTTPEDWRRIVEVNLLGVIYGSMAAYQPMLRQGSGHIVNISSMTGLMATPMLTHYSTTKWGIVGFSTSLRLEAASLGVKVSVACPSLIRTKIADRTNYLNIDKERYLALLPWSLMSEPRAVAKSILRGVRRNESIIIYPFYARLAWWCYRICPALFTPLFRKTLKDFRKLRLAHGTTFKHHEKGNFNPDETCRP